MNCAHCRHAFVPRGPGQLYCSIDCGRLARAAHNDQPNRKRQAAQLRRWGFLKTRLRERFVVEGTFADPHPHLKG